MYSSYYGLKRKPFDLIPDPAIVFMSESHQEALAILRYGVIDRKGFLLLTGDVGTGKTTLLHLLTRSLGKRVHLCLVNNPTISVNDFYLTLAARFGLSPSSSKAEFLQKFALFLEKCRQKQERVVLIIDEAHVLPVKLLEEIRLLSNQNFELSGIMSIFLVGQPELNERLGHERLLPLRQRIGIRFHLKPFHRDETANYIGFRLRRAEAQRLDLFTNEGIDLIHKFSRGVPRLINMICDQALLAGFAEGRPTINGEMIRSCMNELHIPGEASLLPAAREPFSLRRLLGWHRGALLWGLAALLLTCATFVIMQTGMMAPVQENLRNLRNWLAS